MPHGLGPFADAAVDFMLTFMDARWTHLASVSTVTGETRSEIPSPSGPRSRYL